MHHGVYFFDRYDKILTYGLRSTMITLYYQANTLVGFWCKLGSNPASLICQQNTLPIELTRTHGSWVFFY